MSSKTVSENPADPAASPGATTFTGMRDAVLATGTGILVLLASMVNFLGYNEYPLFTPEVGLLTIFLVAVAIAVGLLYSVVADLGRLLLQLVLVFLALDLNFNGIVAILGTAAIGVVLGRHILPFLGIAAGVVLVTGLIGIGANGGRVAANPIAGQPVVEPGPLVLVHIIFDEHIGVEGLLRDAPEVTAMREELKSFYAENGFRLFGGAYSEYLHTINSIPQILNFGVERPKGSYSRGGSTVLENAYFDALGDLGYRIHVSETSFLDYCQHDVVVSCDVRRSADPHDLVDVPIPVGEKFQLLASEMADLSHLMQGVSGTYDIIAVSARRVGIPLPPHRLDEHRLPTAVGARRTFHRLAEELRTAGPGDAYFVHELLPHYPYVMDPDCRLKDTAQWYNRRTEDVARDDRERAYFEQVACLLKTLEAVLDGLAGKDAIVIVHGDHGSRITDIDARADTEGRFADTDLITGYSTLFAVRSPYLVPGYETQRVAVAKIFEAFVGSQFHSADVRLSHDEEHDVVLENSAWEPIERYRLPEWWVESQ